MERRLPAGIVTDALTWSAGFHPACHRPLTTVALVLTLALVAPPDRLLAGYERERGSFGTVYHRGWSSRRREDLVSFVESRLREVETRLRRPVERRITVVLVPNRVELQRLASEQTGRRFPDWVLGLAFPTRGWILVRGDGPPVGFAGRDRGSVTLVHEIAHLVVHRRTRTVVPKWFDEGVCMYVSGDVIPPDDEALVSGLARIDGLFTVESLESEFPKLHHPGTLAYQQSLLMVRFLAERHGERAISDLLDRLEADEPFSQAYGEVTGASWSSFEPEFRRWVISRRSILEVGAAVVNFWTLITLLALVAIGLSILRTRRLRRKLTDAEGPEVAFDDRNL